MLQTRSQKDLILANYCVSEVENKAESFRKIYGGLCHDFPVMIRMSDLAQTVAYYAAKAASDNERGQAYRLFLRHQVRVLTNFVPPADAVSTNTAPAPAVPVAQAANEAAPETEINVLVIGTAHQPVDAFTYMRRTRRLMEAAVYFKRFAVSVLKVETADAVQDDQTEGPA